MRNVFKWLKKYSIETSTAFIIGCPGETKEGVLEKIKLAKELNATFAQFSVLTPYPRTEIYEEGLKKGLWAGDFWQGFAQEPKSGFEPGLWEETLSKKELYELTKLAYKRFYLRPEYIIKSLLKLRSASEFKRKVAEGLKIVRF